MPGSDAAAQCRPPCAHMACKSTHSSKQLTAHVHPFDGCVSIPGPTPTCVRRQHRTPPCRPCSSGQPSTFSPYSGRRATPLPSPLNPYLFLQDSPQAADACSLPIQHAAYPSPPLRSSYSSTRWPTPDPAYSLPAHNVLLTTPLPEALTFSAE